MRDSSESLNSRASTPNPRYLEDLIKQRRVVVCVGSGGVGKTTVAAALALGAASVGRRTLCLTIDPARRLSQSLGFDAFKGDEVVVSATWMAERGVELRAPITVMMLDAGRTFDSLLERYASNPEMLAQVKGNRIYQHLSRSLAGTQAYMAMEKVQAVAAEGRFDLIVLDTPPSERALDFFDAPERMREVIDSPATRALTRLTQSSGGKLGMKLVNSGVRGLLRGLSKVTGASLITELGDLLSLLNVMFGGFAARALEVGSRMKGSDFGYVLVTAPETLTLREAGTLSRALGGRGMTIDALVINRMTPQPGPLPELEELLGSSVWRELGLEERDARAVLEIAHAQARSAHAERSRVDELTPRTEFPQRFELPDFREPIHEPKRLLELGHRLLGQIEE